MAIGSRGLGVKALVVKGLLSDYILGIKGLDVKWLQG